MKASSVVGPWVDNLAARWAVAIDASAAAHLAALSVCYSVDEKAEYLVEKWEVL